MTARPAALAAAALQRAAAALAELSPAELEALVEGRGRLVFCSDEPTRAAAPSRVARTPAATPSRVDVPAVVETITGLSAPADVADFLAREGFTVPVLKEIAKALGPTVSATGRRKADLTRNIVAGTAGFRTRSHAMSGGAWSS